MNRHTSELIERLKSATTETSVQFAYWTCFRHYFSEFINPAYNTDGILTTNDVSILIECKYHLNFKNDIVVAGVVIQTLFYLKTLEIEGKILPKTIFIGDKNECFCLPVDQHITKYLLKDIDWCASASGAPSRNHDLVIEISKDKHICPYIFDINTHFDFDVVIDKIKQIEMGENHLIKLTKHNMAMICNDFIDKKIVTDPMFKENSSSDILPFVEDMKKSPKVNIFKLVDLFMDCFTSDTTTLHSTKANILVNNGIAVKVNSKKFKSFFSHYDMNYNPSELRSLVANKDRMFEEVYKRRTGAFFTPQIWVDEAHKKITETLGLDWKEEYVVWDCAAGTANLTRDYNFKELYISTLEQADINTINDMGYNPGSVKFQYDFLNEVVIDEIPKGLKKSMEEKKKLLFFINPPYGKSCGSKKYIGGVKKGTTKTEVNKDMIFKKLGQSSANFYMQFMYKIAKLKEINNNIIIVIFSPVNFINGYSYSQFRTFWSRRFSFQNGFMFSASNFTDVSDGWGIGLTIWR